MEAKPIKNFFSGGVGGICMIAVGQPLDTVKVRLQTQSTYNGMIDCVAKTMRTEGVAGFYRGMMAPLVMITPIMSLYFWGFGLAKKYQQKHPDDQLTTWQLLKAGIFSSLVALPVTVPVERIKCTLQAQQASGSASIAKYSGPVDCLKQVFKESGIRGVYKGTLLTLMREMPASGVYFLVYELVKRYLTPKGQTGRDLSVGRILLAGGIAGWSYGFVIPIDTLKSRYQTAAPGKYPNGLRDVFWDIQRNQGVRGFFRGFTPMMLRSFPGNAACFLGAELTMKALDWVPINL